MPGEQRFGYDHYQLVIGEQKLLPGTHSSEFHIRLHSPEELLVRLPRLKCQHREQVVCHGHVRKTLLLDPTHDTLQSTNSVFVLVDHFSEFHSPPPHPT